jgi:hypothetical protein
MINIGYIQELNVNNRCFCFQQNSSIVISWMVVVVADGLSEPTTTLIMLEVSWKKKITDR